MPNPYILLGILLAIGSAASTAVYEYGRAEKAQADLASLRASYAQASTLAITAAQKETSSRYEALLKQQTQATLTAQETSQEAQNKLQAYLAKGKANKAEDLGHKCFSVPIPADMVPK